MSGVSGQGVAGFQPFLQTAQQTMGGVQPFITAAAGRTGPTAFQAFESPYQAAVRAVSYTHLTLPTTPYV